MIKHLKCNPALTGLAEMLPDVVYAKRGNTNLYMQILKPWEPAPEARIERKRYPAIVFVQGSAWTYPNVYPQIPQLSMLAQRGFVVATVDHRNSLKGHPFPAYLEDVKSAIRFLRKNADKYQIDAERIGIWGTSSGGNTALLVGITADDEAFKTADNHEVSDSIKLVVDCFGPTYLPGMFDDIESVASDIADAMVAVFGTDDKNPMMALANKMSPLLRLEAGKDYPPFLLLHGNADELVGYGQSVDMYAKLTELSYDAEMVCVDGAPHEGSFWSRELLEIIFEFIEKNI